MKYQTIRIEGNILAADILDKIEQVEIKGQRAADFGLSGHTKDEVARAWADAQDLWRIFQRRLERSRGKHYGTTETRNLWIVPLLETLGYRLDFQNKGEDIQGKNYAISHRDSSRDHFPIHIMGYHDELDRKRQDSGPRMSPHALVQEYLNLTEHLYAIVTNGRKLRLLRDSSRLIRMSFIEFDLEYMLEENQFSDFSILYRLLHATRMPVSRETGSESLIEIYHQDSLDSGSRIRNGLSKAVEESIIALANGFLAHPDNEELHQIARNYLENGGDFAEKLYQSLLRLVYRILFLLVIEERRLVFPTDADPRKRDIYYNYYSVYRLRQLAEKRRIVAGKHHDCWLALKNTFRLFERKQYGTPLGIKPLGGDLFGYEAIGILARSRLNNAVLLACLGKLSIFENPATGQRMRINYAALNVEEFGSVYEGLLEFSPRIDHEMRFCFDRGQERATSGSHYTPDELVQPLIKNSLDHIIAEKSKEKDPKKALLSITVCDVACGSGHILLNAARRIATELAIVRTGEEQPSPDNFRRAIRDVIRNCIYGVDINPLAVELCKVALWLEAHSPAEPLNFLDHRIKCGNSIVGLAHADELKRGIPNEAFKKLPGDDKDIIRELRNSNKKQRASREKGEQTFQFKRDFGPRLQIALDKLAQIHDLPETTPAEIAAKQKQYRSLVSTAALWKLRVIANIQTAQFFIPKTPEQQNDLITDVTYYDFLRGRHPQGKEVGCAMAMGQRKRFFHWFVEFPEIFAQGGFDCILGNPPFLGGSKISGTYGHDMLNWVKFAFAPAGSCDLVTYFLRRNYSLIKDGGFLGLISTNSICEGAMREGGFDVILGDTGNLNFVQKSMRWPGVAKLYISLFSMIKGKWTRKRYLDGKEVGFISGYFEDYEEKKKPCRLASNAGKIFKGSFFLGDGFLLSHDQARKLIEEDDKNQEVIFPVINGHEINNEPEQTPQRCIINFFDWPEEKAKKYREAYEIVQREVKPYRESHTNKKNRELWWLYERSRAELYKKIKNLHQCFVIARTTKHLNFSASPVDRVFTDALFVLTDERFATFPLLQSTIHEIWARKYSSSLATILRYAPTDCFATFPFPQNMPQHENELETTGQAYHDFRKDLMLKLWLGLTKIYNLFHNRDLTVETVERESKKDRAICEQGYRDILELRQRHKQMDELVLNVYGWQDIDLAHDFYAVDYLPENDRVRYTMSPNARKELLVRLLALNHRLYEQEKAQELHGKKKSKGKSKKKTDTPGQGMLF